MLPRPPRSTLSPYTTLFRSNPLLWAVQTLVLLLVVTLIEVLMARMRIDQTVGLWWRYGSVLAIVQIIRSEEHTSELQSRENLVCRLLLEKKKKIKQE